MSDPRDIASMPSPPPLDSLSLAQLLDAIDKYGFTCEAGPLENCAEWEELRRRIEGNRT